MKRHPAHFLPILVKPLVQCCGTRTVVKSQISSSRHQVLWGACQPSNSEFFRAEYVQKNTCILSSFNNLDYTKPKKPCLPFKTAPKPSKRLVEPVEINKY
ncbi:unnamed protein product [Caenorhabditis brenneri]